MSILEYLVGNKRNKKPAQLAKERLQIIIAHERNGQLGPDYLPALREELMRVISKYVQVEHDHVSVKLDAKDGCEVLELNIILPA